MKALLNKEIRLALHPTVYIFFAFALMLLIPSYPYYVAFFYTTLAIFFVFLSGRETRDVAFSALLPVAKRDIVKARCLLVTIIELAMVLVCIPFAIISVRINPNGANAAGMEANAALFGLVLVMYGLFNIIYIPGFYRSAYQVGKPFFVACGAMLVFVAVSEVAVAVIPGAKAALDAVTPAGLPCRLAVLAVGALLYGLMTWLAYKRGAANFQKVDL